MKYEVTQTRKDKCCVCSSREIERDPSSKTIDLCVYSGVPAEARNLEGHERRFKGGGGESIA